MPHFHEIVQGRDFIFQGLQHSSLVILISMLILHTDAVVQRCSVKKVFLEISQNS